MSDMCVSSFMANFVSHYAEPESGWRRIMALTAYVDDSGSDPSSPVYVLGGVVLPAEWWTSLTEEWRGVLEASPSICYFKASEVGDREKGPFKDFTGEQRKQKVNALVDVLCTQHPLALSVSLEWSVFEQFRQRYKLPTGLDDPYFFLYYRIIALAAQCCMREANPTPIDFVFDDQGKVGRAVLEWYEFFAARLPKEMPLGKKPVFGDEKECLPLQAADLFAWYGRRSALNSLNPSWDWQKNAWGLLSRYHTRGEIGINELVANAKSFGIIEQPLRRP
jgi:Protein of unknown function (DUF3800)